MPDTNYSKFDSEFGGLPSTGKSSLASLDYGLVTELENVFTQRKYFQTELQAEQLSPDSRKIYQAKLNDLDNYLTQMSGMLGEVQSSKNIIQSLVSQNNQLQSKIGQFGQNSSSKQPANNRKNKHPHLKTPIEAAYGLPVTPVNQYNPAYEILNGPLQKNLKIQFPTDKPKKLVDYLYLAWDYLAQDRLPKLFSTRLILVLGGGYLTERLGTDNFAKLVSILTLIVSYIGSEAVLKYRQDGGLKLQLEAKKSGQN